MKTEFAVGNALFQGWSREFHTRFKFLSGKNIKVGLDFFCVVLLGFFFLEGGGEQLGVGLGFGGFFAHQC